MEDRNGKRAAAGRGKDSGKPKGRQGKGNGGAGVKNSGKYGRERLGGEESKGKGAGAGKRRGSGAGTSAGRRQEKEVKTGQDGRLEAGKQQCPDFAVSGVCQFISLTYENKLKAKPNQEEPLLRGRCRVYSIEGMEQPFHYRNKVHAVFGYRKGQAVSGVYREGTHELVPVERCLIEDEKADEIIGTIRGMLKSFKIRTYDEDTGFGFLRHVLVRRGFVTGEIMVVFVTASPVFPSRNNFIRVLREKHPEITTIIQNLNDRNTSMVLGDKEKVLYGKGYIEDVLCGCTFRISSKSFYQVNPVQTEKLYKRAIEAAGLTGKETVIDAYCGIGTIGIAASGKAGRVIGVELNQDAVRDAVANARRNGVDNIQFYHNDAGKFMAAMARDGEGADVVFMDPPRSGSTEEFIEAVALMGAKRVVYISCNPETLARDVKVFGKKGYEALGAWAFDMFPFTGNCEVVVSLSRGEIESKKVRVEF